MGEIIVASSTDTPEAVEQAVSMYDEPVEIEPSGEDAPKASPEGDQAATEAETSSPPEATQASPEATTDANNEFPEGTIDDEPDEDETPGVAKGKPKSRVEKRISKLVYDKHMLEAELASAREELQEAMAKLEAMKVQPQAERPQVENFATQEQYEEAVVDYKLQQAEAKRAQDEALAAQKAYADAVEANFRARAAEAAQRIKDWQQVVASSQIELPIAALEAIKHAENGPEVAYYLAKNPDEAIALSRMSPFQAAISVGALSGKLASQPLAKQVSSRAPRPVSTVNPGGSAAAVNDLDAVDYQTFKRMRDQEERERRLRR